MSLDGYLMRRKLKKYVRANLSLTGNSTSTIKLALLPKRYISGSRKEGKKIPYTMTIKDRCMMIYTYRHTDH